MIEDHVQQKGIIVKFYLLAKNFEFVILMYRWCRAKNFFLPFMSNNLRECRGWLKSKNYSSFSGEELAAFEVVVLQMLEDVQERLVYRAQVTTTDTNN